MITQKADLRKLTTIHLYGLIDINIIEDINDLYKLKDFYIIGGGSNLLIKNRQTNICQLSNNFAFVGIKGNTLVCGGALRISKLMHFLISNKVSSLEFLSGMPATIGGAVMMNAGAFGHSIYDKILYIKIFCKDYGVVVLKKNQLNFDYRTSNLNGCVVIEAGFEYSIENRENIKNTIKNNIQKRLKSAHIRNTFGSVFKNPKNGYAGKLLELSELKGMRKNSAFISHKHANYIIGSNETNIDDILFLIDIAKNRVLKNYGIELEEEVQII